MFEGLIFLQNSNVAEGLLCCMSAMFEGLLYSKVWCVERSNVLVGLPCVYCV